MNPATITIAAALLWIFVGCLAGGLGTMFAIWLGEKMREHPFDDDTDWDWVVGGGETAGANIDAGGKSGLDARRLGNGSHSHDGAI